MGYFTFSSTCRIMELANFGSKHSICCSNSNTCTFLLINKWVFPKIKVPQSGWFIMENPIKMDDLGGTIIFGNTQIYIYIYIYMGYNPLIRSPLIPSPTLDLGAGGPNMPSMPHFPSLATPLPAGQEPGSSRQKSVMAGSTYPTPPGPHNIPPPRNSRGP